MESNGKEVQGAATSQNNQSEIYGLIIRGEGMPTVIQVYRRCPKCGRLTYPYFKKSFSKSTHIMAAVMCVCLLCWLPYLIPCFPRINLYCDHCGAYLRSYTRPWF